jgi:hypothetical protein
MDSRRLEGRIPQQDDQLRIDATQTKGTEIMSEKRILINSDVAHMMLLIGNLNFTERWTPNPFLNFSASRHKCTFLSLRDLAQRERHAERQCQGSILVGHG